MVFYTFGCGLRGTCPAGGKVGPMLSFLVPYRVRPGLLDADDLERLAQAVLSSPFLAGSDLDHGFEQTYGFSVLFQRSQVERFLRLLPSARPYLEKVLRPDCQAFLVNPLIIHQGAAVAPHADKTLMSFLPPGYKVPFPYRVSVLYLAIPPGIQGGDLVFHRNALVKARFSPQTNSLVEFPGWLYHEVKPWSAPPPGPPTNVPGGSNASPPGPPTHVPGGGDAPPPGPPTARVSLVCEQYRLKPGLLEQIPEFHLESTRPFADFLSEGDRPFSHAHQEGGT